MDDRALHERMLDSMEGFLSLVVPQSREGQVIRRPGLLATVTPTLPHRSVFNGVIPRAAGALEDALDYLAATYERAGVLAWTVWVPQGEEAARELLGAAGHVLDAAPRAMAAPLEEIDLADAAGAVDWRRADEPGEMCTLLEAVFGWEAVATVHLFRRLPGEGHVYLADVGGAPAACVAALDVDGDTAIWNVATRKAARGHGLATALMRQALLDARERGCATSSLQATAMGRPVYARMGYRDLGPLEMWERRRAA
jgi:GNAT superfamily N-acetyltransferase